MRRLVAAGTGLLATLGTIGVVAPSAQAAPTAGHSFELLYGASYWKGDVTFSNRSATASGVIRSAPGGGCRFAEAVAYSGETEYQVKISKIVCNGETANISLTVSADVPGGVTKLRVGLWTALSKDDKGGEFVRSNRIYP